MFHLGANFIIIIFSIILFLQHKSTELTGCCHGDDIISPAACIVDFLLCVIDEKHWLTKSLQDDTDAIVLTRLKLNFFNWNYSSLKSEGRSTFRLYWYTQHSDISEVNASPLKWELWSK